MTNMPPDFLSNNLTAATTQETESVHSNETINNSTVALLNARQERCVEIYSTWINDFTLYMCFVAIIVIIGLSFLVKRRTLRPDICNGRPGILYPVNFVDDFKRRWIFVACFIISASAILNVFFGLHLFDPLHRHDEDWMLRFGWLSVFIDLLDVLIVCIVYYPLFACASHRQHIVANITGLIYVLLLFIPEVFIKLPCSYIMISEADYLVILTLGSIPAAISFAVYLISTVYDIVQHVRRYSCHKQVDQLGCGVGEITTKKVLSVGSDVLKVRTVYTIAEDTDDELRHLKYVKELLSIRTRRQDNKTLQSSSICASLKNKIIGSIKRIKYKQVNGFHYPTRLVCTLCVSSLLVFWLVTSIGFSIRRAVFDTLLKILPDIVRVLQGDETDLQLAENCVRVCSAMFVVSNVSAGALQFFYMARMLCLYKRRMLKLFRGDNSWHVTVDQTPSEILACSLRYSGYQIAFFLYGWLFMLLLLSVILMPLSLLKFPTIREPVLEWVVKMLIKYGPSAVVSIILYFGQTLMCKYIFLQDKGGVLCLTNRRLYHVASYILFIFNAVVGIFVGIKRIILSIILGTIRVGRLDHVLIMRGFEILDTGHIAYLSMMKVDLYHNHPVMRSFIELLQQRRTSIKADMEEARRRRRNQLRNRWYKAVTMINNPSLIIDRLQLQSRRVPADSEQTDASSCQDSIGYLMTTMTN